MNMRKLFAVGIGAILLIGSSISVIASGENDLNNIESIIYDEDGKQIIEYADIYYEPTSVISNNQQAERDSIFTLFSSAPIYKYTLGGYNDNSFARAQTSSNRAIDYMYVKCGAYRDTGAFINDVSSKNPSGTTVKAMSATVKPADYGLNYKVASAYSYHQCKCSGFEDANKTLNWNR